MKHLSWILILALALVALPREAEAQFRLGARGKLLLPTGDFNDVAKTGWGLAATGDFTIIPLVKLRGEIGYNQFDAEDEAVWDDESIDRFDIWSFLVGARLQLPVIYLSLDGAYYTKLDEVSLLPGLGLRFLFLDVGARYKWTGENWIEVFGGVSF
ncbi:MAG: hypothetical protein P8049_03310 [Gemmatimonadota bacterium]